MARRVTAAICGLMPGEVRELVDAFNGDDRAVHVAQQEQLAPVFGRQHVEVERLAGHERCQQPGGAVGLVQVARDLRGLGLGQPVNFTGDNLGGLGDEGAIERMPRGVGDEAGDGRHRHSGIGGWEGPIEALVVIGGSTASGKSALALALARRVDGIVINADSQQLFADLPTLTARPLPTETEESSAPAVRRAGRGRAAVGRPLADAGRRGLGRSATRGPDGDRHRGYRALSARASAWPTGHAGHT